MSLVGNQVMLINPFTNFFEEGCFYQLTVSQCVFVTQKEPQKCLDEGTDFTFEWQTVLYAVTK